MDWFALTASLVAARTRTASGAPGVMTLRGLGAITFPANAEA
ncbi:hypothetical protein [Streptomyces sp. NPDC005262]